MTTIVSKLWRSL